MIRLLIADDHEALRAALRSVLGREPDIDIVAEACDGAQTLALVRQLLPDLVLMDIAMPVLDGIEATRLVIAQHPSVKVLGHSSHLERRLVRQMLANGALGYISKSAGRDELLQAVRSVAAGRSFLCQETAALMAQAGPMSNFSPLA
jgi:two-component system NarL family response regulator